MTTKKRRTLDEILSDHREEPPRGLRELVDRQAEMIEELRVALGAVVDVLVERTDATYDELEEQLAERWNELDDPDTGDDTEDADEPDEDANDDAPRLGVRPARERHALVTANAPMTDPFRGMPARATPEMIEAADALLQSAYKLHYNRRFADARVIYRRIVDEFGITDQAQVARQQLENLRGA